MSGLPEWRAKVLADKQRADFLDQIKRDGAAFIVATARGLVPDAIDRLRAFVSGDEFAFIKSELAKAPYDAQRVSQSYALSIHDSASVRQIMTWPRSILVLTSDSPPFLTVTYAGLSLFVSGYSLWSGPKLSARRTDPEGAINLVFKQLCNGLGSFGFLVPDHSVDYEAKKHLAFDDSLIPVRSWQEWTAHIVPQVESSFDLQRSIVSQFERFIGLR